MELFEAAVECLGGALLHDVSHCLYRSAVAQRALPPSPAVQRVAAWPGIGPEAVQQDPLGPREIEARDSG